jgi:hypothetical protein
MEGEAGLSLSHNEPSLGVPPGRCRGPAEGEVQSWKGFTGHWDLPKGLSRKGVSSKSGWDSKSNLTQVCGGCQGSVTQGLLGDNVGGLVDLEISTEHF